MRSPVKNAQPLIYAAILLSLIGVSLADYNTKLGVTVWVGYCIPVVLAFWSWRPLMPPLVAVVAVGLIIFGFATDLDGVDRGVALVNRSFGTVTIFAMAGIGVFFIRTRLILRREEWIRIGMVRLSERMVGDHQLEKLGDRIMESLCTYMGAQVGAIYMDDDGVYHRRGGFAAPPQGMLESFTSGEGLLGQVASSARAFTVDDLPDNYITVSSGLGSARPHHLLIAPASADGHVHAVIELGFFKPISDLERTLLERVSEVVGRAVRTAEQRAKVQELLEETQRQSEELQAQSEELRVNNEELEEQSRALQTSSTRLEMQQVELEQTNTQLEEQATLLEAQKDDLTRKQRTMLDQARELERSSRYKSEFLANMSHELRTPLNSTLILAKLLEDNADGNLTGEQVKYAHTIRAAGNDLLALINDVLDLSKVESGHMELRPETLQVNDLIAILRAMFEPLASQKNIDLRFTTAPGAPQSLETDPMRLEQVLKNLMSNALKFTDKGVVEMDVSRAPDGRVAFAVRDTGIGIALDHQDVVFQPFTQADGTTVRKYGGTGLGLSISRQLARLLQGEIHLASEPGKGSTFTVLLPERMTLPTVEPIAHERASMSVPQPKPSLGPLPARPTSALASTDDRDKLNPIGRYILVVEDDPTFASILSDLAHELDFQCVIATTAEEALELAQQQPPSAVVLDVGLPDHSGLFVLEQLKRDTRTRHIPVHVVSGTDHAEAARAMGAMGYMLKPVKREELQDAFLKLQRTLDQDVRRVLVVEDNAAQLDAVQQLLGTRDVQTRGARNAAECLEQLKEATFDCMVLDLTLPDSTGFALLEKLAADDQYAFPPVIIYTGRELAVEEEQRLRKYASSIIIKGAMSPERLLDEVTLFLHQVVSELPPAKQKMLEQARNREAALEGRTILLVEDDVRNLFALTSLLEQRGVKTRIARNGLEALSALEDSQIDVTKHVDLVLMDIMMPEMDGLTAMRKIRERAEWKKLPIIALTAKAMKHDQEQCLAAGANDYLAKPLDAEKLLSLIRVWMPR